MEQTPKTSAMMGTRYREAAAAASALLVTWLGACAPEVPPAWRIAPAPLDPLTGEVDALGKLRILAISAEPPEAAPGQEVALSALLVTHPRSGEPDELGRGTPRPRGLDLLWLACRPQEGLASLPTCGLGDLGVSEERELGAGEAGRLRLPPEAAPGTVIVTLVAADGGQPGGARGCLQEARQRGAVLRPNRCVLGQKRVKISTTGPRNQNPAIESLALLPDAGEGPQLALRRAADAVEREPDPSDEAGQALRDEVLTVAWFATAGTLEAGRGAFTDPACADEGCAQLRDSAVRWTAPEGEAAALEAPAGRAYFFAVLRDDRGGLSFRSLAY